MTPRTLVRVVRRARDGDVRAFGRIYDEYADRVYAFVRARVGTSQDAEDVTAAAFMKAWEAIGSYDDRGLPFSAWLFRIARNAVVDEYRRTARRPSPAELPEDALGTVSGPDESMVASANAEQLKSAVRRLTDDQAAVIALRFWWDRSLAETAAALGKNENAVKALQHRALRSLARILSEEDPDVAR